MLGVVLNKVPKSRLEQVCSETSAQFTQAGVSVLAVLPEDRTLLGITIGELAEQIQGEILSGAEKSAELVENIMLGALCVDPGPDYFGRKANKAVEVRSERPDVQMAAMETSTRCLILTGNIRPGPQVISRAEEKGIPMILTRHDTMTAIERIEGFFGKTRFHQKKKIEVFEKLLNQHMDFAALYQALGLPKPAA